MGKKTILGMEYRVIAAACTASDEVVQKVIDADPNSDDGRSEWFWVLLADGDWMLATFPQGDTYIETENDRIF